MEKIKLDAKKRKLMGRKVKELRDNGILPTVLYGKDKKSENLEIDLKKFIEAYKKAGTSALVDLQIEDNGEMKILIHDVQFHPITSEPIHADLYAIKMDEKINTEIPLRFTGVSPAVKDQEGSFIANYDAVEVECLPGDLIHEIEVDISGLKTFEDQIKASDLNIPEKIKLMIDSEEVIALVNPPRSEEELEALEDTAAGEEEKEAVEKMEEEAQAEKEAKEAEKSEKEGGDAKKEDSKQESKSESK